MLSEKNVCVDRKNRPSKNFIKIFKRESNNENIGFGKNGFDQRNLLDSMYLERTQSLYIEITAVHTSGLYRIKLYMSATSIFDPI